ncbi:heat shock protein 70 [Hamiltosporidium tvaerminnensis]|uniref:Heat shock protein 70 n=1 Tax=Hamiltosporidium tvaerminnensis TaxID=1176355 RepID=A0A4Q9L8B3_9MICR|nr:heat shock protein 70 [Hamiltosporidium tvaerminnensis]
MTSSINVSSGIQKIIGIDLGTTNSCVSVLENNIPIVIENSEGNRTTPSVVSVEGDEIFVGEHAKKMLLTNPTSTIFGSKRLIGRKFMDNEIQKYIKSLPYSTFSHVNGDVWINIEDKKFSPSQIGAFILSKMKETAEKYLNTKITKSVITVPAYFNDKQRQATKDAGAIAGLDVIRIINEPTAAALSYGLDKSENGIVAVYDLGGGTFDISILELKNGIFEVKSTNGDTNLGGEDIDNEIVTYLVDNFNKKNNVDLRTDKIGMQRIKEAAENLKKELSVKKSSVVRIPFAFIDNNNSLHLEEEFTRSKYENIVENILRKTVEPCKKALRDAKVELGDIKHVILVGGMTRMPLVRKIVKETFGIEPISSVNPDEVVAKGAAIQAGVLKGEIKNVLLLDVVPLSLGIETVGGIFSKIVNRNTTTPFKVSQIFTTSEDNQDEVDIKIYQGERPLAFHNKYLGNIKLKDIKPLPKGVPRIEVIFEADSNGIYKITAKDQIDNKEQSMEIIPNGGLTEQEIDRMINESEQLKTADLERKKNIEFKNEIENIVKTTENFITNSVLDSKKVSELNNSVNLLKKMNLEEKYDKKEIIEIENKIIKLIKSN